MEQKYREKLKKDHLEILDYLNAQNYVIKSVPLNTKALQEEGESVAMSFPIQGILKYHGMVDSIQRIGYFPSISFNNGVCATITYIELSKSYSRDYVFYNDGEVEINSSFYQRVHKQLDFIRSFAHIATFALVVTKNVYLNSNNEPTLKIVKEKGLGTSASAGSAIATAMIEILYSPNEEFTQNARLRSILARYLAGSASRSAVGGISLWLNYPEIKPENSFSIRLDKPSLVDFITEIDVFTLAVKSDLQTTSAHESAPNSPFFMNWALRRKEVILEFCRALNHRNFQKMGEIMEEDTMQLHAVSLTTGIEDYIIAWEPITLRLMKFIKNVRKEYKIPVYFSIDTGPTLVFLTLSKYSESIKKLIHEKFPEIRLFQNKIAGEPQILDLKEPRIQDILHFHQFKEEIP